MMQFSSVILSYLFGGFFFFTISKFLEFLTSDGDGILINVIQMVTQDIDYKSPSNYSFIEFVFVLWLRLYARRS